jgi:DNA repair exonuclease SbcCD ATPase subunit
MSDIKLLKDQITGLTAKLENLRKDKSRFDKAKGYDESIAKFQKEAEAMREDAKKLKDVSEKLTAKKNAATTASLQTIMAKMNEVLPMGKAVITVSEDGDCFIGWHNGKVAIPYPGLSGGEKVAFDTALVYALGGNILVTEAAELDDNRLADALTKYGQTNLQCIVMSAHEPAKIPEGWEVVRL